MNSLYVNKPVRNIKFFTNWAKSQGFDTVVPDPHVTLAYSRAAVSGYEPKGEVIVLSGSEIVEIKRLGSEGAVVIAFKNKMLSDRWKEIRDLGASWDYPEYTPHVTITYNCPEDFDLSTVKIPKDFTLVLGKEEFEELDEDKAKEIKKSEK